jgi:heme exporter protein D
MAAEGFDAWLAMGGYAAYVWPAYGLALVALVGLLLWSILGTRALERRAAKLRRTREEEQ